MLPMMVVMLVLFQIVVSQNPVQLQLCSTHVPGQSVPMSCPMQRFLGSLGPVRLEWSEREPAVPSTQSRVRTGGPTMSIVSEGREAGFHHHTSLARLRCGVSGCTVGPRSARPGGATYRRHPSRPGNDFSQEDHDHVESPVDHRTCRRARCSAGWMSVCW